MSTVSAPIWFAVILYVSLIRGSEDWYFVSQLFSLTGTWHSDGQKVCLYTCRNDYHAKLVGSRNLRLSLTCLCHTWGTSCLLNVQKQIVPSICHPQFQCNCHHSKRRSHIDHILCSRVGQSNPYHMQDNCSSFAPSDTLMPNSNLWRLPVKFSQCYRICIL